MLSWNVDTLSIPRGPGIMAFTPRTPHIILQQDPVWTAIGLFIQILDALFFIYIVKNFTRISRFLGNRAIGARHGKRTIVIVDNPCIHQLAENFCSKLFAQGMNDLMNLMLLYTDDEGIRKDILPVP